MKRMSLKKMNDVLKKHCKKKGYSLDEVGFYTDSVTATTHQWNCSVDTDKGEVKFRILMDLTTGTIEVLEN